MHREWPYQPRSGSCYCNRAGDLSFSNGDLTARQVKELEGLRGEAEAARAAVQGVADKEAALARRATALAHLQKMPAELQVQRICSTTACWQCF